MRSAKIIAGFVSIILTVLLSGSAMALPSLQLDILGGTYDNSTETIVSSTNPFTLYAYLIPDANAPLSDWYYISAAITPKVEPSGNPPLGPILGSFTFDGVPINVTGDMTYGTPPYETYVTQLFESGDLSKHSIFNTYFIQFAFQFDQSKKATAYNTQDNPGAGPTPNSNGTMFYEDFIVNTMNLNSDYEVHFDLYNSLTIPVTKKIGGVNVVVGDDIDINSFAPFSHDAESRQVPEPSTLLLLGSGLIGLGLLGRKRFKA